MGNFLLHTIAIPTLLIFLLEKIVLQKLAVEKVVNNPHKKDARILLFDIYSVTLRVKKLILQS
jgi:hypothetical protein